MATQSGTSRHTRMKVVIVIAALLLVGAGGAAYWWWTHKPVPAATSQTIDPTKYVYSVSDVNSQLAKPNLNNSEKASLYVALAHSNALKSDYQAAADAAKQAAALDASADNYALAASYLQLVGDKTSAIDYYKKALALVPVSTDPTERTPYNSYAAAIESLGGTI